MQKIKKWMKVCPHCGFIAKRGRTCPKCKNKGMIPVTTPRGTLLVQEYAADNMAYTQYNPARAYPHNPQIAEKPKSKIAIYISTVLGWVVSSIFLLFAVLLYSFGSSILATSFLFISLLILPPLQKHLSFIAFPQRLQLIVVLIIFAVFADAHIAGIRTELQRKAAIAEEEQKYQEAEAKRLENVAQNPDSITKNTKGFIEQEKIKEDKFSIEFNNITKNIEEFREPEPEPEPEALAAPYIEKVKSGIDSIQKSKKIIPDNIEVLKVMLALYSIYAELIEESKDYNLTDKDKALVKRLKSLVVADQKENLPKMRDKYGIAVRKLVWEHDVSVKTFGTGFKTIEYVSAMFAANRNAKEFFENVQETLHIYRFKRAQFKWYNGASEYPYFTLDSLNDDDLVVWEKDGYRLVE